MTDHRDAETRLAQERADLAAALGALRDRLMPGHFLRGAARGAGEGDGQGRGFAALRDTAVNGGLAGAARPAVEAAGAAIRANPLAATLAGAGLAWLAWSGIRTLKARPAEARPQWLVEGAALREEAERLQTRIAKARADGLLDEDEAQAALEEVGTSLQSEIRLLMGRGLDGLEAETRAAALAAREAAWAKEFAAPGGWNGGGVLTAGSALAAAGGLLALWLPRRSAAETARAGAEAAAQDATEAARRVIEAEAARLTEIATGLSRSLREILDGVEAQDLGQAADEVDLREGGQKP